MASRVGAVLVAGVGLVLGVASAAAESSVVGDLPRRADLGFRTAEVEAGLRVEGLEEGSPAAAGGLRDGDVITAVAGTPFARPYVGADLLRRLDGGDAAVLTVLRADRTLELRFRPEPVPLEALEGVDAVYGVLDLEDGSRLRTIVTRPAATPGPLPALFVVQWVSCSSIEIRGSGATRELLRALVERTGMVTLRVERSSAGDSEGPGCHELDYDTELEHYRRAFDALTTGEGIDSQRVVAVGLSLGATMVPLVVHDKPVAGVVVNGGGALTYFERMVRFDRINLERRDVPPEEIHSRLLDRIRFHSGYLLEGKSPERIAREHPELREVWAGILGAGDGVHYGRPYAYHQQAARKNFLGAWARVGAPVLVLFGEYDQFETRHGHELIADTVNRLHPGLGRFVLLERTDHDYGVYASAEDAYSWTYGPSAPGHDAPEVAIGEILTWLRDTVGIGSVRR